MKYFGLIVLSMSGCLFFDSSTGSNNSVLNNGTSNNGTSNNGTSNNGTSNNGISNNGSSNNGMSELFYETLNSGWEEYCAIRSDGRIECWGENLEGILSPINSQYIALTTGRNHVCGMKEDGRLACWGKRNKKMMVLPGIFKEISAGNVHTCGLRMEGGIECWGSNAKQQINPPSVKLAHIAAAYTSNCGIKKSDSKVVCWGSITSAPPGAFVSIVGSVSNYCGKMKNGSIKCWGTGDVKTPPQSSGFGQFDIGLAHGCGILEDKSIQCWGKLPLDIPPPDGEFEEVVAGWSSSCALTVNGKIQCWGDDKHDQLNSP